MTDEQERLVRILETGEATPEQQREAARIIRDFDNEVRELTAWGQRG
ncbi:MAG: hypothetical protein ACRD3D_08860 [Terriglobia bacterium]